MARTKRSQIDEDIALLADTEQRRESERAIKRVIRDSKRAAQKLVDDEALDRAKAEKMGIPYEMYLLLRKANLSSE